MKTAATILFGLIGATAVAFGLYLSWILLSHIFTTPVTAVIQYSSKQIDLLSDTAKALIPTVAGFAVLAASGSGYLHARGFMRSQALKLGVLSVFVALVLSVACWVYLLGAMVDCSFAFERYTPSREITPSNAGYLQRTYGVAVISAKLACVSFFFALDIALLVTVRVFSDHAGKRGQP